MIRFLFEGIEDELVRDNFKLLSEYLQSVGLLKGNFSFFEYTFNSAVTDFVIRHSLGFVPKDLIQTSVSNSATVTWKFDQFTREEIVVTTSAACRVRYFLGAYVGGVNV